MSAIQKKGSCHLPNTLHTCKMMFLEDQQQQGTSLIAQPVFVFEKREQTFKRPADNTLHEAAEHECNGFSRKRIRSSSFTLHTADSDSQEVLTLSQKRMRSSSFTELPVFPPSGPVKKNNIFMTPALLQRKVNVNSEKQNAVKPSEQVLRPAILQPPPTQRCEKLRRTSEHKALESCKTKEAAKSEFSAGNSYLLHENLPSVTISVQLSTPWNCSGAALESCQPNEDVYPLKSCHSDFTFGENMVERVSGTQKFTQSQLENDLPAKEKIFKSTLKFPTDSPNSRANSIKTISLLESAAVFSSKPSTECLLEKIDVVTGEEAEHNVLKINCKLFIFNKPSQSWIERGRGTLRLNDTASSDSGTFQSRLIMRNQGSLRLILNSKLWAQMEIQRANHKSLRITATNLEDYSIKVFLIQGSAKDTGCLYAAIHHRLVALRSFDKQNDTHPDDSQSETVLQHLNVDSCDEDEDDLIHSTRNRSGPSRWTHRQSVVCS